MSPYFSQQLPDQRIPEGLLWLIAVVCPKPNEILVILGFVDHPIDLIAIVPARINSLRLRSRYQLPVLLFKIGANLSNAFGFR